MNKDEHVELLDEVSAANSSFQSKDFKVSDNVVTDTSFSSPTVADDSDVSNVSNVSNISLSAGVDSEKDKSVSRISPLVSKPTVVGTTANSPRISPDATFAATTHSMKQQAASKASLKALENEEEKPPVAVSTPLVSNQSDSLENGNKTTNKSVKPVLLILVFVLLLGAIIFLPYSQKLFDKLFAGHQEEDVVDDITNGHLICTTESDDGLNSYQYTETYSFEDSEVDTLEHEVLIQGSADYLNERDLQCQELKASSTSLTGVSIDCDLSQEEMIETQFFNFSTFDSSNVSAAFTEAGGILPNVKKEDDYKEVQRVMEMSGYDCKIK